MTVILALVVAVLFAVVVEVAFVAVSLFLPLFIGLGERATEFRDDLIYVVGPIAAVLTGIVTLLLVFFYGWRPIKEK